MFSEPKESQLQLFVHMLDRVLCGLSIWTPNVPIMTVLVLNLEGHLTFFLPSFPFGC